MDREEAEHSASVWYLGEVVEGLVQVGVHASRRFIGDLDGVLQDALRDDVALRGGGGLCTYKHPEVFVASLCVLFQKLLQRTQPASHQVDVLQETGSANKGRTSVKEPPAVRSRQTQEHSEPR
ncbi:hypothetical protein EYF80_008055 [Liparis tanakae]|uniref:Uncharacterized protein n=1 Tax=Liparis tanakae TaxID=230148 RepID=A0A4Z2IUC2_9TELE|nr:hypothetical protein EYF80_008055 [Liparis tanakae]